MKNQQLFYSHIEQCLLRLSSFERKGVSSFWKYILNDSETNFLSCNNDLNIPLVDYQNRTKGYRLIAPIKYEKDTILFRVPQQLYSPWSSQSIREQCKVSAPPFFLEKLNKIDEQLMPSSYNKENVSTQEIPSNNNMEKHRNISEGLLISTQLLLNSKTFREDEFVHPYANFLIHACTNHPLILPRHQLRRHLKGTNMLRLIQKQENLYLTIFSTLFGNINYDLNTEEDEMIDQRDDDATLSGGNENKNTKLISARKLLWSISVVLSRASSSFEGGAPFTLLPYFDLMNHSLQPSSDYYFDHKTQMFVVKSCRDIAEGEEITIDYGEEKDMYKMLRIYGFIDEESDLNPQMNVTIPSGILDKLENDQKMESNVAIKNKHIILFSLPIPSPNFVSYSISPFDPDIDEMKTKLVVKWNRFLLKGDLPSQLNSEYYKTYMDLIDSKINLYPSAIDDDIRAYQKLRMQILGEDDVNSASDYKFIQACLYVNIGEKIALLAAKKMIMDLLIASNNS